MATNFRKLAKLLEELFRLDQSELDFGVYRIMNQKRDELVRFLQVDLLPQVRDAFESIAASSPATIQDGETSPVDRAAKPSSTLKATASEDDPVHPSNQPDDGVAAFEEEVFSHLYQFFRRYYREGDFISQRRYREGVYAIPYEGEEIKLYWANHDQYYVKSNEHFRDYAFTLKSGKRVRTQLTTAAVEQDNRKDSPDRARRYVLAESEAIGEENGELVLRFEYRLCDGKQNQHQLNKQAANRILTAAGFEDWRTELAQAAPTSANPQRTILHKHLDHYTARHTYDYFIHKDLGGFLRQELDFYVKNEVLHLDDVELHALPRFHRTLSVVATIRTIAHKIIAFLEQLENFQKRLWLKKKFVVATNYSVTLDRIPQRLYPRIVANEAQCEEWVRLFAVDKLPNDGQGPASTLPLTIEFLQAHPSLSIDTRHFDQAFVDELLQETRDLDDSCMGVVIGAENFQALSFIASRYRRGIKCVYIDPPYNTDASAINYKNGYKSSSWVAMLNDRLEASTELMTGDGVLVAAIDDQQQRELSFLLESNFSGGLLGTFCVRSNPSGRPTKQGFSVSHEYLLFAGNSTEASIGRLPPTNEQMARFNQVDGEGVFEWRNLRREGSNSDRRARPALYYPIYLSKRGIRVPPLQWDSDAERWQVMERPTVDETIAWPTNNDGVEKTWRWEWTTVMNSLDQLAVRPDSAGRDYVYFKRRPHEQGVVSVSSWIDSKYSATEHGTALLKSLFGGSVFSYPKSIHAVMDSLYVAGAVANDATILDYFAGSGTTGHAVIRLNQRDQGRRKFILAEVGRHVDDVLLPRLRKVIFAPEWSNGIPTRMPNASELASVSGFIKYVRLESYEDTLNNLRLERSEQQQVSIAKDDHVREHYLLSYMLDVESRGSPSLLNVNCFRAPDQYQLRIERDGETRLCTVDLVETFNWLLGLSVTRNYLHRGVRVVEGVNPMGNRVLVIWRNVDTTDSDELAGWFREQGYDQVGHSFGVIYVNGDNHLEQLRSDHASWTVRLIEEEFKRLMFEMEAA